MGSLKDVQANELAIAAGKAAIERAGIDPTIIDELTMGQVYPHGQGSLPARQVAMACGLRFDSTACNVNQNCASGMRALEIAVRKIQVGKNDVALVIGVESMTNAPYLALKARMGYRMNAGQLEDAMIYDGLFDRMVPGHMGITAENVAEKYGITREECDELALMSHQRATRAVKEGTFKREVIPFEIKSKRAANFMKLMST